MITITELFPRYKNAVKWYTLFCTNKSHAVKRGELHRLLQEYTVYSVRVHFSKRYNKTLSMVQVIETVHVYTVDNLHHRIDGPSMSQYINDRLLFECWSLFGNLHREDDPAYIEYMSEYETPFLVGPYTEGDIYIKKWYRDGKLHRTDGPARIFYNGNREVSTMDRWENGTPIGN